jgi:hypothetical protein
VVVSFVGKSGSILARCLILLNSADVFQVTGEWSPRHRQVTLIEVEL